MAKMKKGDKLVCSPCGREVSLDACGISSRTIWCCGKPMKKKTKTRVTKKNKPAKK